MNMPCQLQHWPVQSVGYLSIHVQLNMKQMTGRKMIYMYKTITHVLRCLGFHFIYWTMTKSYFLPPSPLCLPNAFPCVPLEIVILDVRLIYKTSSITTTVITIASTMMIVITLEAMAAVFVDVCAEGNKVREKQWLICSNCKSFIVNPF